MNRTRAAFALGAVLTASLALSACAGGASAPSSSDAADASPVSGGTLTYLANTEPGTWDGQKVPSLNLNSINSSIFDPLVVQAEDGTYKPHLATGWEISDDGLVYTFTLRDDVVFHDGTPFNAAVLKQNLDRPLNEVGLATAGNAIVSTAVLSDDELQVTLGRKNAAFIHALSTPHWPIYSGKVLSEHTPAELGTDPALSIGTGPFRVKDYAKGSKLVLERNPDYAWAPETVDHEGPAYLDEVVIQFVPETQARIGALNSKQADAIDQVPPLNIGEVEAVGNTVITQDNTGTPYYLALNTNIAPFDDKNVRLAFREAIDIDALLKSVYGGVYSRSWTTTLPGTPPVGAYDESLEGSWGYDLDKAQELLDEAGWDEVDSAGYRVKDGERLHIDWYFDSLYVQTDQRQQLGEAIASSLKDAGFEVERIPFDTASFTAAIAKNEHNLADASRGYADVGTSVSPFTSSADPRNGGNGINYGLLNDEVIDAQYAIVQSDGDPEARIEAAHIVQARILDEGFAVPLYIPKKIVGTTPAVHGWTFDAVGYTDSFYDTWLSE
ncbi:ABC transporter substrate-binding protein [Microbacterium oxydans]|uniref:ABC transporter substrate-binding protein n=1 Tax=Microbacterium oxydans TaxID=82380 RepID=UPI0036451EF1